MRKLVTKISDVLPFGKTFFVFGENILGNGVNDLENGTKNDHEIKNPAPQLMRGAGKNKHTMRKLVTNVCFFMPIWGIKFFIVLGKIIIRYFFARKR